MVETTQDVASSDFLSGQRMGKIGAELVMKATICAASIALVAGMFAILFG